MPEIVAARRAGQAGTGARAGIDLRAAGGIGLIAIAGLLVYPYAKADETPITVGKVAHADESADRVSVSTLSAVRESPIVAPPLTLPYVPRAEHGKVFAPAIPRNAPRSAPDLVAAAALESTHALRVGDVPPRSQPTPEPGPPQVIATADPLQTLRSSIGACSKRNGVFERAMCEQRARLEHCDGHWGAVELCPAGRTDFGQ